MRGTLKARSAIQGEYVADYGWIRLPYTGDGDLQEVYYHANQAAWHDKDSAIFRSLVIPGTTVVDVGANLGFVTTMLSACAGPRGRVLAFEPSKATFGKLRRVVEINELRNVSVFNVGCGDRAETRDLARAGRSSGNASLVVGRSDENAGDPGEAVELVALDDVPEARAGPVSLLKIDTEGFEPFVLKGARSLIAENRPVVYLELTGEFLESTLHSIDLLREMDYDVRAVASLDWSQFGNGSDFFFLPGERAPGPA